MMLHAGQDNTARGHHHSFSVGEARTCDYVFLAVDGDFAEEYAMKITEVSLVVFFDYYMHLYELVSF
jgi:hypothetical protein